MRLADGPPRDYSIVPPSPPAVLVEASITRAKVALAPDEPESAWLDDRFRPAIALDGNKSVYIDCGNGFTAVYTDTMGAARVAFCDSAFSPSGDDLPLIPIVFTGLAAGWPALGWNATTLAARCVADDVFAVDGGPSFARESLNSAVVSMRAYAEYAGGRAAAADAVPLYIFDPDIGKRRFADGTLMSGEYAVPRCFSQDFMEARGPAGATARPLPTCWLLVGAAGSGTPIHNHPMTAAWNTLFSGTKLWVTLPPDAPPESLLVEDACPISDAEDLSAAAWLRHWKGVLPAGANVIVQRAGETVFLPASFYHVVLNVDQTTALSRSLYLRRDWVTLGAHVAEKRHCEGFARIWQAEKLY